MATGSRTRVRRWALLAVAAIAVGNVVLVAVPWLRRPGWVPVAMLLASGMLIIAIHLLARPLSKNQEQRPNRTGPDSPDPPA
jgi:hypothetical protein